MSVVIGIDLGTTTITALALRADSGDIIATATAANAADITSVADKARGRSEWDAGAIVQAAFACLRDLSRRIGASWARLAGFGKATAAHVALASPTHIRDGIMQRRGQLRLSLTNTYQQWPVLTGSTLFGSTAM